MKLHLSLSFLVLMLLSTVSYTQTQGISYTAVGRGVATTFVTDYHTLGINSSALGWGNEYGKRHTTGSTEFNFGIYSDSLNVDKLRSLFKSIRQDVSGKGGTADWETQKQYAQDYLNAGIMMDANYNWLGYSYHNEKFGGIAFNIGEQYSWYSRLNEQTTDLIFEGKLADYFDSLTVVFGTDTSTIYNNGSVSEDTLSAVIQGTITVPLNLSSITSGSEIRFAWNRYYNFGYGRKLFGNDSTFALYAGIGGRFIQSMAMMTLESDGTSVRMYSAFSPNYNIDYGTIAATNPSNYTQMGGFLPKPVGMGYGVDVSASAKLFGILKLAAAINNLGSITYTRNVYRVKDSIVGSMQLNGLESYNVTNSYDQLLQDGGILALEGQEKFAVPNAANFRLGASIDIGKVASIGADFVAPFDRSAPGSLANGVISFGADIKPAKWITISAGYFGGGIYKHNIPVGLNFIMGGGTYEMGISSRDILTFLWDGSNSVSAAFGFARVRF